MCQIRSVCSLRQSYKLTTILRKSLFWVTCCSSSSIEDGGLVPYTKTNDKRPLVHVSPQLDSNIIQICHASVGILMECLPEGGWFSLGLRPRGDILFGYPHWYGVFVLLYRTNPNLVKISMKTTMTSGRSAGAVEKSVCCLVYNVNVTDD